MQVAYVRSGTLNAEKLCASNFVVLNQGLTGIACTLRTMLSTKGVQKSVCEPGRSAAYPLPFFSAKRIFCFKTRDYWLLGGLLTVFSTKCVQKTWSGSRLPVSCGSSKLRPTAYPLERTLPDFWASAYSSSKSITCAQRRAIAHILIHKICEEKRVCPGPSSTGNLAIYLGGMRFWFEINDLQACAPNC